MNVRSLDARYFHVDAFADGPFSGNPAGVCALDAWLPESTMQSIAAEIGLAATAFLVPEGGHYGLRWFTPWVEEALCGHGTLAAGCVILEVLEPSRSTVSFKTRAGMLAVSRDGPRFAVDLPARPIATCERPPDLQAALGMRPQEVLRGASYVAVLENSSQVEQVRPDLARIAALDLPGLIVTAPGRDHDCDIASRYFAPAKGIPEDPVTGSLHAQVVPFWASRLGRNALVARQLSRRGGTIHCMLEGDRIRLSAQASLFMTGTIALRLPR